MLFYVIDKPKPGSVEDQLARTDAVKEEGFNTGEAVKCPKCGRYLSSLVWLPPYRVELETWGREYGDIVDIGYNMIISERLAELCLQNSIQGFANFELIDILKVKYHRKIIAKTMPRYYKATVSLSSTEIDQESSGYIWRNKSAICPTCHWDDLKCYSSIVIKNDTWNGDDIFYPLCGTRLMVSERFKSMCENNLINGAIYIDPKMESYDYYPWEPNSIVE
jgi:hypothetical protein